MWHAYEDVICGFQLGCVASMVCSFFLHVTTSWLVIRYFVQCLSIFLILLCVFIGVTCLVLCGIDNALLAFIVVMPFSHNIATSLCCYNVDHFILVVAILKYDCKPTLNTILKKRKVVSTYKP
jgi:hypothetical protein